MRRRPEAHARFDRITVRGLDPLLKLTDIQRHSSFPMPGRPAICSNTHRPQTTVFVSAVSAWEMEIKRALGKLDVPDDLEIQVRHLRFLELPVHPRHVQRLRKLPKLPRDPFDRMLVAQAMVDGLTLVTRDRNVMAYPVKSMRC